MQYEDDRGASASRPARDGGGSDTPTAEIELPAATRRLDTVSEGTTAPLPDAPGAQYSSAASPVSGAFVDAEARDPRYVAGTGPTGEAATVALPTTAAGPSGIGTQDSQASVWRDYSGGTVGAPPFTQSAPLAPTRVHPPVVAPAAAAPAAVAYPPAAPAPVYPPAAPAGGHLLAKPVGPHPAARVVAVLFALPLGWAGFLALALVPVLALAGALTNGLDSLGGLGGLFGSSPAAAETATSSIWQPALLTTAAAVLLGLAALTARLSGTGVLITGLTLAVGGLLGVLWPQLLTDRVLSAEQDGGLLAIPGVTAFVQSTLVWLVNALGATALAIGAVFVATGIAAHGARHAGHRRGRGGR